MKALLKRFGALAHFLNLVFSTDLPALLDILHEHIYPMMVLALDPTTQWRWFGWRDTAWIWLQPSDGADDRLYVMGHSFGSLEAQTGPKKNEIDDSKMSYLSKE